MLGQLSKDYLLKMDQYIKSNLGTITCGEVRDCYQSFIDISIGLTGIHSNYKSLPEYIIHRFLYYLCEQQISNRQYGIITNKQFLNKYGGKNELDIALVIPNEQGNKVDEPKVIKGISIKAAKEVDIDLDSHRANNLIWGTNKNLNIVLVTFNDKFKINPEEYIHEQYKIINLDKERGEVFAHELKKKLNLSQGDCCF
ncbi:hypothetical protein [Schinkia azotoformans]|uniref:hypothetical protein n=1 Tax=Schinkia azotoformans TaxID=1454 RepID=UPI002DBB3FA9|nr:hypothetical protein [Schinkia azotoformans]MEC1722247.1 hypothetical protein [Schinkia azotoformans]MED4412391.1 hypothetical protein [Schinkia azotoformans]